jgi:cbb3-type cytochrome oxidase subunit 3
VNPVFRAAAESAQLGWVMGLMTVVFLGVFLAWTWYAWNPANKQLMQDMAAMPLNDGGDE